MPLQSGSSREVISANIAKEVRAGHDPRQAAAIAFSKARGDTPSGQLMSALDAVVTRFDALEKRTADCEAMRADGDYEDAKRTKVALQDDVARFSKAMQQFKGAGSMNLLSDSIRNSAEYRTAKSNYDNAFAKLRDFNGMFTRHFKDEYAADRRR